MIEIKAGSELDRQVAEAVGDPYPRAHNWEHTGLSGYETSFYRCMNCGSLGAGDCTEPECYTPKEPCVRPYSTDLNAAFEAAERVDLWRGRVLVKDWGELPDGWRVVGVWQSASFVDPASTPALAICAAILPEAAD